jgi:ubiquinone/menaquinone biosynthesis C-methylase UbiE
MDEDEFARALLAHERRDWQQPEAILDQIGIEPSSIVADLGCGPGFFTIPIARRLIGGRVFAIDSSPLMLDYLTSHIKKTKTNAKLIKIKQADVSETKLSPGSVDVALFANIFHDIEDKSAFLQEVKRISKKGSSKIVDVDWIDQDTPVGPPLEIRLSENKARKLIEKEGFRFIRKINGGPYHYGFIFSL